ncbi:MAG: hypothetical protein OXB93_05195 [Cytophagales bacterium]|nr:hypothetical protein [Cytophagales bacterium]
MKTKPFSFGRFLFWQLWFLLLIAGGYLVYRRMADPPEKGGTSFSLRRNASLFSRVQRYRLPDELIFCGDTVLFSPHIQHQVQELFWKRALNQVDMMVFCRDHYSSLEELKQQLNELNICEDLVYLLFQNPRISFFPWGDRIARAYGLRVDEEVDERYHGLKSLSALARGLRDRHDKFPSALLGILSFYVGEDALDEMLREQKDSAPWEPSFSGFNPLWDLLASKLILSRPQRFGYRPQLKKQVLEELPVSESIPDLGSWGRRQGYSLEEIRFYNPWIRGRQLRCSPSCSYVLSLPEKTAKD